MIRNVFVDIGGTNLRFGLDNAATPDLVIETPKSSEGILNAIRNSVLEVARTADLSKYNLLVACPGLITPDGTVEAALHIDLSGVRLREELESILGQRVLVVNDANAQCTGCTHLAESVFYLTVGTGVGGAILEGGRLLRGDEGFAGEIGHISVGGNDLECPCGQVGCVDAIASGWALEKLLGPNWWRYPQTETISTALFEAGFELGLAAALAAILLNPKHTIVGGKIPVHEAYRNGFHAGWRRKAWSNSSLRFEDQTWPLTVSGLLSIFKEDQE